MSRALRRTLLELGFSQDMADQLIEAPREGAGQEGRREGQRQAARRPCSIGASTPSSRTVMLDIHRPVAMLAQI